MEGSGAGNGLGCSKEIKLNGSGKEVKKPIPSCCWKAMAALPEQEAKLHDTVVSGWFSGHRRHSDKNFKPLYYNNPMWPGEAHSLKVEEVLYEGKSKYQEVLVFKSLIYGKVLVLDGIVQLTEKDECAYQEMIAHLPLCSISSPKTELWGVQGRACVVPHSAKEGGCEDDFNEDSLDRYCVRQNK